MTDTPGWSPGTDKRAPVVALTVLGAAIGMIGGFVMLISGTFGLFLKPISESMNWTRSQVSLLADTVADSDLLILSGALGDRLAHDLGMPTAS